MTQNYLWKDNPTEANSALYDPDVLNECLMHLKYSNHDLTRFCVNSASVDANGNANLMSFSGNKLNFNCGNSLVPIMSSNTQAAWSLTASHQVNTTGNDIYSSFNNDINTYCALQHLPSVESPAAITITNTSAFTFDYLYLKFASVLDSGSIKSFYLTDAAGTVLYSYNSLGAFLDVSEFLIPIKGFNSTKLIFYVTANVNNANYVNFPAIIKLLDKTQVIKATNARGEKVTVSQVSSVTLSAAGTYNIFLGVDGTINALANLITQGKALPTSPASNQVHYLTSAEPPQAKQYNGSSWVDFDQIPLGYAVATASGVSSIANYSYNQNGYNLNPYSWGNVKSNGSVVSSLPRTIIETYVNGNFWYRLWSDGWIEQGGTAICYLNSYVTTTLLLPYSNTNFTVFANRRDTYHAGGQSFGALPLTLSTFGVYLGYVNEGFNPTTFVWEARGY